MEHEREVKRTDSLQMMMVTMLRMMVCGLSMWDGKKLGTNANYDCLHGYLRTCEEREGGGKKCAKIETREMWREKSSSKDN